MNATPSSVVRPFTVSRSFLRRIDEFKSKSKLADLSLTSSCISARHTEASTDFQNALQTPNPKPQETQESFPLEALHRRLHKARNSRGGTVQEDLHVQLCLMLVLEQAYYNQQEDTMSYTGYMGTAIYPRKATQLSQTRMLLKFPWPKSN